jgi:hypothetical protein
MYASVCWAYRWVEIAVKPCRSHATLQLECGEDVLCITLADDQLRQIEAVITEWLDARAAEQTKEATAATVAE